MATSSLPKSESLKSQPVEAPSKADWTQPRGMAVPKEGYFKLQNGRYGPIYPRTPACHGFTIIAKIKPGREDAIRAYGVAPDAGRGFGRSHENRPVACL